MVSEIKCLRKKEGYFPKAHLAKVPILLFSDLYCLIITASNKLKEVILSIFRQGCSYLFVCRQTSVHWLLATASHIVTTH